MVGHGGIGMCHGNITIFVVSSHAAGPGHHLQVHHIINDYQKILLTIDFSPGTDTTYLRIKTRRTGFCSLQEHIAVGGIPRQPKDISDTAIKPKPKPTRYSL